MQDLTDDYRHTLNTAQVKFRTTAVEVLKTAKEGLEQAFMELSETLLEAEQRFAVAADARMRFFNHGDVVLPPTETPAETLADRLVEAVREGEAT